VAREILGTVNADDWQKAAALITKHTEAATADINADLQEMRSVNANQVVVIDTLEASNDRMRAIIEERLESCVNQSPDGIEYEWVTKARAALNQQGEVK
jgi:hypothetical protein